MSQSRDRRGFSPRPEGVGEQMAAAPEGLRRVDRYHGTASPSALCRTTIHISSARRTARHFNRRNASQLAARTLDLGAVLASDVEVAGPDNRKRSAVQVTVQEIGRSRQGRGIRPPSSKLNLPVTGAALTLVAGLASRDAAVTARLAGRTSLTA
jgi:hypothetical protein